MSSSTMATFLFISVIAGSLGWAIRGTTLGKEKGAMLPGAMLGLLFAWFSGIPVLQENFWIFSAVGALGMFVGGTETYAQTMDRVKNAKPSPQPVSGYLGLAMKGALWFGIAAGFLGLAFTAMTGKVYSVTEILIFFALMPVLRAIGIVAFNHPFKPKENVFPRIYLSSGRREEWGGMLMMLLELLVFVLIKQDGYTLRLCLWGMGGGAVGWVIGIFLMYVTMYPLKSGKYIFGSWQKKGMIDNWKIMENTLGAVGALGMAIGFALGHSDLQIMFVRIQIDKLPLWNPTAKHEQLIGWLGFAALIVLGELACALFGAWADKKKKYGRVPEIWQQAAFTYFAVPLVLLGNRRFAQMISFFVMYWVISTLMGLSSQKVLKLKNGKLIAAGMMLLNIVIIIAEILLPNSFTMTQTLLMYCLVYFCYQLLFYDLTPHRIQEIKQRARKRGGLRLSSFGTLSTVEVCKLVEIVILLVLAFRTLP